MIKTVEWTDEGVRMIDQRKLPTVEEYPLFRTYGEVAEAIRVGKNAGQCNEFTVAWVGRRGSRDQPASEEMDDGRHSSNLITGGRGTANPKVQSPNPNYFGLWTLDFGPLT